MKNLHLALIMIMLIFILSPCMAQQYFGGLTNNQASHGASSSVLTLIATDSVAPETGTIVEIRTNFSIEGTGYYFKVKVFRKATGNNFNFIQEGPLLEAEDGFHSYYVQIPGVQIGDYLGLTIYPEQPSQKRVFRMVYLNGTSNYYLYNGDHNEGTQEYTQVGNFTVCIDALIGEPPPTMPPSATPTLTPTPTITSTPTITPTVTPSFTPGPPTMTPTPTKTPLPTMTPTPTKTPTSYPYTPTETPQLPTLTPTISPTATEELTLGVKLFLNDTFFTPYEDFHLYLKTMNPNQEFTCNLFVVLDVYGQYWFWPDWTQELNYVIFNCPNGTDMINILEFVWPQVQTTMTGLKFWGAMTEVNTFEIIGNFDYVEWGFGPR